MKLLAKAKHYPEFVALQEDVDAVVAALDQVRKHLVEKDDAKPRFMSERNAPQGEAKLGQWLRRYANRKVELTYANLALEEAIESLASAADRLSGSVEKGRQFYGLADHDLQSACAVNVLLADGLHSEAKEQIFKARQSLFDHPELPAYDVHRFLAQEMCGNRRQFTVRFINRAGRVFYVKRDRYKDFAMRFAEEIPAVPCMTQFEAQEREAEFVDLFRITAHCPPEKVEVYDIVTGDAYRHAYRHTHR